MEKLKSLIPNNLKRLVADSSPDDLPSTSSSLLDFILNLPKFQEMIKDLTDPETALCTKSKDAALESKQKGNQSFSSGDYKTALHCYSQALRVAPISAADMDKNLVATLYLNRASSLHKIGLLTECIRDCSRAIQISPNYSKAWYRRGKANASLGDHKNAVHDMNMAKSFESSLSGKRQIESELKIILQKYQCTSNKQVQLGEDNLRSFDDLQQKKLVRVTTPVKGRGIASCSDIPPASLIHMEEPYVLMILKSCRETHCHYCLNELPADVVPCTSCSIPLYCSERCQLQAGGETLSSYQKRDGSDGSQNYNLRESIVEDVFCSSSNFDDKCFPEHRVFLTIIRKSVLKIVILLSQIRVNSMAVVRMRSANVLGSSDQWGSYVPIRDASTYNVEQVKVGQAIYTVGSLFNHSCRPNIHAYFLSRTLFIRTTELVETGCHLELSYGPQVGQFDCKERVKFLEDKYSFRCQCPGCSELNMPDLVINAFHCAHPNCSGVVLDSCHIGFEMSKFKNFIARNLGRPQLQVDKLSNININDLAARVLEQDSTYLCVNPEYCLKCGLHCDLIASEEAANKTQVYFRRLQDAMLSKEISSSVLSDALRALAVLRSVLNGYNKCIAEVSMITARNSAS
ncbi:hypothetical protein K2173_009364 [Erythroxylum novogranatense]|uniref:SET domain-containing protein n=1 Tax=Erythroxylum novogranatense TaxID=1862640 RepID=A0AAV8U6G5_9ROSI|nr:hypothetical protein K2173_009364 [Erythroxylum novogranatense]